jgi:acetyl esterase
MPLNTQSQAFLDMLAQLDGPALNEMSPAEARVAAEGFVALAGPGELVADVENRTIPGPAGDIPVRIYTPEGQGPFGALVYFHGGGWVIGTLDTVDSTCRMLANRAACKVVSVDYRMGPEHKFPAAAEDCYAATRWVQQNGPTIDVDPARLAVGGDSAGGNLAAVVCLMARDRGGPRIAYQVLIYPVTNYAFDTASYRDNADGYLLTKDMMVWFWNHYIRGPEDGKSPYASPLLVENTSGLPPALVITAEYDPLRDEGEAYAASLRRHGVKVKSSRYPGIIHGFFGMPASFSDAQTAVEEAAQELRGVFER